MKGGGDESGLKVRMELQEVPGNSPWRVLCHPPSSDHLTTSKLRKFATHWASDQATLDFQSH